jgi:hypothetical protein
MNVFVVWVVNVHRYVRSQFPEQIQGAAGAKVGVTFNQMLSIWLGGRS